MDLTLVVIDACLGGLVGGATALVSSLIDRRAPQEKAAAPRKHISPVLPAALACALTSVFHWDAAIAARLFPLAPRDAVKQKYGQLLVDDPAFAPYMKGKTDEHAAAAQLSARGMHRLPIEQIREAVSVRLLLASQSPKVCSGMWTGKADPQAIERSIDALSLPDLERFYRVTTNASLRELHGEGDVFSAPADPVPSLRAAMEALGDRGAELGRILGLGEQASESDGCAGVKLLYEAIGKVPDDRARELFALATQ